MVEESLAKEKKASEIPHASEIRPAADFYELVRARNPKTGKRGHYLHWWNREDKELIIEEVDANYARVDDSPVAIRHAESKKSARKMISGDIEDRRKKGLKIKRRVPLKRELLDEARVKQGILLPYYEEMLAERRKNVKEAWQYYEHAKSKTRREQEEKRSGRVYRKSVFGPTLGYQKERQKENLGIALNELGSGLRFFNRYLDERIGVDDPIEDQKGLYGQYARLNKTLSLLSEQIERSDSLEEKGGLLKEYEGIFEKRLNIHNELARERGYYPLKEIPEEMKVAKPPKKIKVSPKPKLEKKEVKEKGKEREAPVEEKVSEPQSEIEHVEKKLQEQEVQKPAEKEKHEAEALKEEVKEVKNIDEALSASAKGLKEKGSYTFALKGSGFEELVRGIIPQFKEVWERKGIKIVDFSIDADIKPDASQIDIDLKVKKGLFSPRIQATLMLVSEDGVLSATRVSAKPKKIGVGRFSYNVQEMIEENIGGEKIHPIINKWLASEVEASGAKLEKVEFSFTPQDTLQVKVVGGAK